MCGNTNKNFDIVLSEKDRYGISIKFLLCQKCSIIRTDKKLDKNSLSDFYSKYYRQIYGNGLLSIEDEYIGQVIKGRNYKRLLEQHIPLSNINTVFDFGCGTGGVLYPFKEDNKLVYGSDYNNDRLNYGKGYGLNLLDALTDFEKIRNSKYDLVILSHVMEHFSDPIVELNNLFELISDDGYILIIVPSPLYIGKSPQITCRFFQNVHLYNFNKEYLVGFFDKLGMEIVYIDEECQCILRKPHAWIKNDIVSYNHRSIENKYEEIIKHFKKVTFWNDIFKVNIIVKYLRRALVKLLEILRVKNIIKKYINKISGI